MSPNIMEAHNSFFNEDFAFPCNLSNNMADVHNLSDFIGME